MLELWLGGGCHQPSLVGQEPRTGTRCIAHLRVLGSLVWTRLQAWGLSQQPHPPCASGPSSWQGPRVGWEPPREGSTNSQACFPKTESPSCHLHPPRGRRLKRARGEVPRLKWCPRNEVVLVTVLARDVAAVLVCSGVRGIAMGRGGQDRVNWAPPSSISSQASPLVSPFSEPLST